MEKAAKDTSAPPAGPGLSRPRRLDALRAELGRRRLQKLQAIEQQYRRTIVKPQGG